MLNVKIDAPLDEAIARQAKRERRTKPAIVHDAVVQYLDYQKWKERKVKKGLASLDAGNEISHAELVASLKRQRARRARTKAPA